MHVYVETVCEKVSPYPLAVHIGSALMHVKRFQDAAQSFAKAVVVPRCSSVRDVIILMSQQMT